MVEVDEICKEVFVGLSAGPEFYLHCFAVALPNELFLLLVVVLILIFFLLLALDLLDQQSQPCIYLLNFVRTLLDFHTIQDILFGQLVQYDRGNLVVQDDELIVLYLLETVDHLVAFDEQQEIAGVLFVDVGGQFAEVFQVSSRQSWDPSCIR